MPNYRKRIAEAIIFARESVGVSQRDLSERLKRDKRTLQKWEKGEMKISMEDFLEIFEVLKLSVEPYFKWIRHPELFSRGMEDITCFSTDRKRIALVTYYAEQASPAEIDQKYYLLFGDHGSNYYGILQQQFANLQTPLRDRKRICRQIMDNYKEACETNTLTNPDAPQPNMELLTACYIACVKSVHEGHEHYFLSDTLPKDDAEHEADDHRRFY